MRIYFMGICGTAMGNAALLARAAGHEALGADSGIYPPMSAVLAAAGIDVREGYDEKRLERLAPDLVVIGNAQSRGNPEVEWLLETGRFEFTSLPAFLHDRVLKGRRSVVVAGTHGKTTTTALAAYLMRENGSDPGYLIGGVPGDPPGGSRLGGPSEPFVIEGDEYDSAFFDKRSKFIHYAPHIAVLNNLEFDHADIFRDLADVQRTFAHFVRLVPRNGWIVMNGDDANLRALEPFPWTRTVRVGTGAENDVRIAEFSEGPEGAQFELSWRGAPWARVRWSLPGIYNARNAAMAATAVSLLAADASDRSEVERAGPGALHHTEAPRLPTPKLCDLSPLARFRGVRRRQEVLASSPLLTAIEDFGHHPTALAQTLRSLRSRYPGAQLTAVFEPRSNTARIRTLQDDFAQALAFADSVYLGPVNRPEKLKPAERFDPEAVASWLREQGRGAGHFSDNAALLGKLVSDTIPGGGSPRVVVFFSNGSFDGIVERYASAVLSSASQPGVPARAD